MGIIIVEPTSSGFALVEAARQMGEEAFVFAQDEQQIPASCRRLARAIVTVDTNDVQAVVCAARRIEKDAQSEDEKIRGILPGFEYTVDVVAKVALQLGLPHLSMQAAALTRNKFACRERLKAKGLDVPRYALISDYSELERVASEVGFPAVLKPVDGSGSLLVRRIDSLAQLRSVLADPVNTGLLDMGKQIGSQLLLEEYLEGREFSIEGYIDRSSNRPSQLHAHRGRAHARGRRPHDDASGAESRTSQAGRNRAVRPAAWRTRHVRRPGTRMLPARRAAARSTAGCRPTGLPSALPSSIAEKTKTPLRRKC